MDVNSELAYKKFSGYESLEGLQEGDMVEIKIKRGGIEQIALEWEPNEGEEVKSGNIIFQVQTGAI